MKRRSPNRRGCRYLWLGTVTLFCATTLEAEGFRNPPPGAFDLGRAGGRIAQIDDSSAVAENPANLVDLLQSEVQFTPTIANLNWKFNSATASGQTSATQDPWKFLPNLFASVPIKDSRIALGFGITTPYGIGSEWDVNSSAFAKPTGILRYQSPHSTDLTTLNFNPSIALHLNNHVQIGAGLDVMYSELTLKQYYPWFLVTGDLSSPDGNAKAKGDGTGVGGNIGVTLTFAERHRF